MNAPMNPADPHRSGALRRAGPSGARAAAGLVLLHGRGAGAGDMLRLHEALALPDVAVAAPDAAGRSWWPTSFLAPYDDLQPWLASALAAVDRAVAALEAEGLPRAQIHIGGFSQGACLALEAAARRGESLGGVYGLSGGLVGTSDQDGPPEAALYGHRPKRFDYPGDLSGMPVYLGCHAQDPHIPLARVEDSARILGALGGAVTSTIHRGAGHAILAADVAALRAAFNAA